jgi:hypothetical protein
MYRVNESSQITVPIFRDSFVSHIHFIFSPIFHSLLLTSAPLSPLP